MDWSKELQLPVLEFFWPAIHFQDLVVRIGDQTIDSGNLPSLLEAFSGAENFTAHQYFEAFTSPTSKFEATLTHLKKVEVYLRAAETELPKRVAMVRESGMVIWHKRFNCVVPYCGVFFCRNKTGNALLRDMEPPRHDKWDPDFPNKGDNRNIESEFR